MGRTLRSRGESWIEMSLGKIERHILIWAHRQHDPRGIRGERWLQYLGKSGALLAYARELFGRRAIPNTSINIKATMPHKEYMKLHCSFTRALKRLSEKGLIVYEPDAKLLLRVGRQNRKGERSLLKTMTTLGKPGSRRSMFVLTRQGEKIGRDLWMKPTVGGKSRQE